MSQPSAREPAHEPDAAAPRGGFFREWVLPVVIGLAIGGGLVMAWKHGGELFRTEADRIVARWQPDDLEQNDGLVEELKKLGADARGDLLQAFRAVAVPANPDGEDEWKVWVAQALAGEPFFDKKSLLDIARDPAAPVWDRRCAAAALVHTLRKDVDPTAVVEPLLGWLEDMAPLDHVIAVTSLDQLRQDRLFPPQEEPRLRRGLLKVAARASRPLPADEYDQMRLHADRSRAIRAVGRWTSDAEVRAAVWAVAIDESDDSQVRSDSLQTLAGAEQFSDAETWKKAAASADAAVRQTVADNLGAAQDPAFDAVLAPLHADASEFVRRGSIEAQSRRNRPTMLPLMGELLEDASAWVRYEALLACGTFRDHREGLGARQGMVLRLLETSDADEDVSGAAVALRMMTGLSHGFAEGDVDLKDKSVRETALAAFKKDREARRAACDRWRETLGKDAVWTDADRRTALGKLLGHADPANRKRAEEELAKLPK